MGGWAAVVIVFVSAAPLAAQAPAPAASPSPFPAPLSAPADPDPDSADISFTATVEYRELRFDVVGDPKVEFEGGLDAPALGARSPLKTVWHVERINLPSPLTPGATYRDGGVRLTITTRFEDLPSLLADPPPSPLLPPPPGPDVPQP
jgi:hypothetical protein